MGKRFLAAATVVVVIVGTMVVGVVRLSAAAATQPASGAVASDCVTPAMMQQARARQERVVCISEQPPPGASKARSRPGPPKIPAKQKPPRGKTAVSCPIGEWDLGRHEVCADWPGYVNITREYCSNLGCIPVLVGWVEISTKMRAKTQPHQASWVFQIEIRALSADGEGMDGLYVSGLGGCQGACTPLHATFPSQHLRVGHMVSGDAVVLSTIAGAGQKGVGHATMQVDFRGVKPSIPGSKTYRAEPDQRCDSIVSTQVGCVFPEAGIVLDLYSNLYPDIAYHVNAAQNSGLVGRDIPLHRLMNKDKEAENRHTACRIRPPLDYSCDEYPFASTYEGAATWGGGEGAGRTFDNCQRPDLPTGVTGAVGWSGCMVPKSDNDYQGGDLSEFYWRNHVIDMDDFYVETF